MNHTNPGAVSVASGFCVDFQILEGIHDFVVDFF